MKKLKFGIIAGLCLIVLAYATMMSHSEVLVTAQDRNVFVEGWDAFAALTAMHPFGLIEWLGSWMTQLFYWPAFGMTILLLVWLITGATLIWALELKGAWQTIVLLPLACLLASELDLGYWVYILQLRGYWFAQSLGYLCVALVLLGVRLTPERWRLAWYAIPVIAFPFFGWTAYLMALILLLSHKPKIWDAVGVVLTAVAPLVWYYIAFRNLPVREVWVAGFPLFESPTVDSLRPSIPFFVLIAITLLIVVLPKKEIKKTWLSIVMTVVVVCASAVGVFYAIFNDYNYLAEMRMTQAAMADDWKSVLDEARVSPRPSRTMVILKNIALMNEGDLGDVSFVMNGNSGVEIYNPDSLNLNMMQIAAPLVYYNYGCMNFAIRWCIENVVGYGYSPFYLKNLARCSKATGEEEASSRYVTMLRRTMCYKDWTPKVSPLVAEMKSAYKDELGADNNSCDRYLIEKLALSSGTGSSVMQEQCLFYSILMRDNTKFWPAFTEYVSSHKDEKLPRSFQEAYIMFNDAKHVDSLLEVKISPEVMQDYNAFWAEGQGYANMGMDRNAVSASMWEKWGGTYWWYNAFGRTDY